MVTKLTYGSGLGKGISSFGQSIGKGLESRAKKQRIQDIMNPQQTQRQDVPDLSAMPEFRDQFEAMLEQRQADNEGEYLTPDQENAMWEDYVKQGQGALEQALAQGQGQQGGQGSSFAKTMALSQEDPNLAKIFQAQELATEKMNWQEKIAQQNREFSSTEQKQKEWRDEIKQNAEPYSNLEKLQTDVRQLELAKDVIMNSKEDLSWDDNWARSAFSSILGDKQQEEKKNFIKTDAQRKLYSYIYDFLRTKELGGSNPSTREVQMALQAKPSQYMGKEGNLAVINLMLEKAKRDLQKGKLISKKRAKAGPISPGRFNTEINEEIQPFLKDIQKQHESEGMKLRKQNEFKGLKPKKGYVRMYKDGEVRQILKKDIRRVQDTGGELLYGN